MDITLKNKEIVPAFEFFAGMPLKNENSRHRSKIMLVLRELIDGLQASERELMRENDLLDETGELKPEKDRELQMVKRYHEQRQTLLEETVLVQSGAYVANFKALPRILKEYEGELSGEQAMIYDRLLDEFEKVDAE